MRWKFVGVAAIALLVVAFSLGCLGEEGDGGGSTGTGDRVDIEGFAFRPATLTVPAGTTVTWENHDSTVHDVTSTDGNFTSSGDMGDGATHQYTFDQPGEYPYFCAHHPDMTGTVVVTA